MSISTKTALPIILMAILLSLSAFLIQRNLILPAFTNIEKDQAKDNIDRVVRRLEGELRTVDFTVYDWSSWDDTYRFLEDQNDAYVSSNLNADTFWNYGFEIALMMDMEGTPVWAGVYDFQAEEGSVDQTGRHLADILSTANRLSQQIDLEADIDDRKISGVFELDGTPVLYSMRPVHRSDGSGEPRGFVMFGQRLSAKRLADLAQQIVLTFTVAPVNQQTLSDTTTPYTIKALDDEHLKATRLLTVDNKPQLEASVILERNIARLGSEITLYSVSVFVLLSLVLSAMLLVLFRNLVVRPILDLKRDISSISNAMDYSMRAQIRNHDEIGLLSQEFNSMLNVIESNNRQLKKLTETDPLTGLYNRLALDRKLQQAWSILTRTGDPLSVLLIDIDHFKAFNDHYGHLAGDDCLIRIASILQDTIKRDTDMVARYGGEEFLIVLPGTSARDAQIIAKSLIDAVAEARIEHHLSMVKPYVTVSVGLSAVTPSPEYSLKELISSADKALYRAKEQGRNCVCSAPPSG
ncbi:diguanylate cyclase [Marinobacter sp. CHS3-4]|uniref:sensor domain-containing diguanylate cyclase n=1 Tax=Marinobacter sp. CHS3-4 TaxID=3045174 RepID=UPI0024B49489|nr:diguanylate cyclase [Marinobacter sp. CHS3-4]MDI9246172.1 diguanylate cyclase [Marinobacter sp. CHS3-4]